MNNISAPILLSPHSHKKDNYVIATLQKKYQQLSNDQKLINISAHFLNTPYQWGPLGEGEAGHFDQSPFYRTDKFDCVTFVNTVLALTFTNTLLDFQKKIVSLNYLNNQIAYQNRCHFISLDWNFHNSIDNSVLEDITSTIKDMNRQPLAETATAVIDKNGFFQHRTLNDIKLLNPVSLEKAKTQLKALQQLAVDIRPRTVKTDYLPIIDLFHDHQTFNHFISNQWPRIFILEVIRPNWDLTKTIGTHLNVSHLGFCFKNKAAWIFRHASRQEKKVVDIPLTDYLNQYRNHPTIQGINIQKICGI